MIIVSQDKVANINYEKIEVIYLLKKNGKIEINARGNYDYTIGRYATEERAKEVLREIVDTFGIREIRNATYQYADLAIKSRRYSIYEMPKE